MSKNVTKCFFDTEFTGLHKNTTPISIGIISDCGKTFYCEFNDYDKSQCDEWINVNVIDKLLFNDYLHYSHNDDENQTTYIKHNKQVVTLALIEWLSQFKKIEFWGDCIVFDWIVMLDLLLQGESARNLPKNFNTVQPFDVMTLLEVKGENPKELRHLLLGIDPGENKHNALYDASITKKIYERFIYMG
jgi:hypothetical protein